MAFLGQTFSQGFFYLDYAIDRAAYEKKCINKFRPQMHCNGKCQLMKKIEEQEKKEQQQAPQMKLAGKAEVISSRSFFTQYAELLNTISAKRKYILTNIGHPVDQAASFFHPPDA